MSGRTPVVVTISRQIASGGAYIGQRVAQRLGLRYVDREILREAAAALGSRDEETVEALEEHAGGGVWGWFARAVSVGAPDAPFVPPPPPGFHEGDVLEAETKIIREIAAHGDAVIVGRGAAHILRGSGIMRVFVHAPEADRIREVQTGYGLDEAHARQMVQQSDRNRARFVESLIHHPWTDACLYDLTLNTSVFPLDLAVTLIVSAIKERR